MTNLKSEDIMRVKVMGFLLNRGTDRFLGRVLAAGTVFSAQNFADLGFIAENFGNGKLICTSRQCVEVPGIPLDKIPEVVEFAAAHGLRFGGTGNKIRPVTRTMKKSLREISRTFSVKFTLTGG